MNQLKGHESIKGRNHQARQGTAKGGGVMPTAKGRGEGGHSKGEGAQGAVWPGLTRTRRMTPTDLSSRTRRGSATLGVASLPPEGGWLGLETTIPRSLSAEGTQTTNQGPQPPSRASLARHVALFAGISGRTTVGHRTWFTGRIELCCVLALCIRS